MGPTALVSSLETMARRDILGEKLHQVIRLRYPELAVKLTGNFGLLASAVCAWDVGNEDSWLEHFCSNQLSSVTTSHAESFRKAMENAIGGGMLLELPVLVLDQMVHDDKLLSAGLQKALITLQNSTEKCAREKAFCLTSSLFKTVEDDTDSDSTDSLGDQLYDLVDLHNTGHSEKITGMLLEVGRDEIKKLVSNPELLEQNVNVAQRALEQELPHETSTSDLDFNDVKERLGEKIFEQVENIDPQNCACITGMLLELDPSAIEMLLSDSFALKGAVERAQAALPRGAVGRYLDSDLNNEDGSDLDNETETLGEELYCYINNTKYSQHSSQITGMLLEMPNNNLVQLLKSPKQLDEKIQVAAAALEGS